MKRDMELCRKILFAIEEQYTETAIVNLKVDGYSNAEVAYHCDLLYDANLITYYKAQYAGGQINAFGVGHLTWDGHDFLDQIRENSIWTRVKSTIKNNGLPMIIDVIQEIASAVISSMTEGAIKAMRN